DRLLATAIEAQRGLDVQSLSWSMVRDIASTDQSNDGQQHRQGESIFLRRGVIRSHTVQGPARYRWHVGVGPSAAWKRVAGEAVAWDGGPCVHTRHSEVSSSGPRRFWVRHHDRAPSLRCDGGHWTRFGGGNDPRAAGTYMDPPALSRRFQVKK